MLNDDHIIPDGAVMFAQISHQLPTKSVARHIKYATDHWTSHANQPKLSIDPLASLEDFMNRLSEDVATRYATLYTNLKLYSRLTIQL